jgi:O-antigen/teichoic acid export membrane protein
MSERFAQNTFYGVLVSLSASLGSFATTIAIGRTLGVADSGVVNFALWIVGLASAATDLGVYGSLTRYLPETTRSSGITVASGLAGQLLRPYAAVTAVGFGVFAASAALILLNPAAAARIGLGDGATYWLLIGALLAGQNLSNFVIGFFQGMQRFRAVAGLVAMSSAIRLVATVIGGIQAGAEGALMGYVAGVAFLAPVPFLVVAWRGQVEASLRRRVKRYALFSWGGTLAAALITGRPEVALLNHFGGSEAVGLYTAAFTLANIAVQGPMMLTSGLIPFFSENSGSDGHSALQRMMASATRILTFLILPMCFGIAALASELVPMLFGRAFAGAADAAVILLLSFCLSGNTALLTALIGSKERNDFSLYLNIAGAALTVVLGFALIPAFGIAGAAAGRAVVQLGFFAASAWFVVRHLGFSLPLRHLVRLLVASMGCAGAAKAALLVVPGAAGLVCAIPAGALVYLALVRALGGVHESDVQHLSGLFARLPAAIRLPATAVLTRLVPAT